MELSLFCFIQKVIYQLNTEKRVKIVVIGNGGVGKTSLLFVLNGKPFPIKYIPTIYESSKIIYEDFLFYPWDTAGQDEYDRLRPLSYSAANIILLCFELDLKESFIDLSKKWIPEIKRYAKDAIIILIGTKSDLYIPENPNHVSENEAFMFTNQQKFILSFSVLQKQVKELTKYYRQSSKS